MQGGRHSFSRVRLLNQTDLRQADGARDADGLQDNDYSQTRLGERHVGVQSGELRGKPPEQLNPWEDQEQADEEAKDKADHGSPLHSAAVFVPCDARNGVGAVKPMRAAPG
jgi:hypothetical protein